jgi:iron complex outermembrane receptor protein
LGKTIFGGEIINEGILSTSLGYPTDSVKVPGKTDIYYTQKDNRTNVSYFLEHNASWRDWNLSIGILAYYNTALNEGFRYYPGIDVSYHLSKSVKLYASINKALRMPTFTDLYYKGTHIGNPNLKPEEATAYELGVNYSKPSVTAYLAGYYRQGKNMIDWVKTNPGDPWESKNLTDLNTYGIETSVTFYPRNLFHDRFFIRQVQIGYSYISQNKNSYEYISNYALDYLKHKFLVSIYHDIYRNFSMQWNFRRQDRAGSYTKYENLTAAYEESYTPYSLLNAKINWKHDQWNVYLEADNIFDVEYYDLGNIPQPGFWLSGGIKYRFN